MRIEGVAVVVAERVDVVGIPAADREELREIDLAGPCLALLDVGQLARVPSELLSEGRAGERRELLSYAAQFVAQVPAVRGGGDRGHASQR